MPEPDQAPAKPAKATRPKPGERRVQILQTLAMMLQQPGSDRVTTAALARRLEVSEAALYRHFASKAQMFEGLIDFIERSIFSLINQITTQEPDGLRQLRAIISMLLAFADKNPGMTRVLVGDALTTEDPRLQGRINQITERLETSLKQSIRNAISQQRLAENTDPAARASTILSFVMGRWLLYAKSDFKRPPNEGFDHAASLLLASAMPAQPRMPAAAVPGGQPPGGQNPGGQNPGGQVSGGQNPGGQNLSGQNPGGHTQGGQTAGGQVAGGQAPGGLVPQARVS